MSVSSHQRVFGLALATAAGLACATLPLTVRGVGFFLDGDFSYLPDYDADGGRLTRVMEAAAVRYGRILRDNWSINLSYRYAPPGTVTSLAGSAIHSTAEVSLAGGGTAERAVFASVVFNSSTSWYFDPTPLEDSEFDFSPVTYDQLSSERRRLGFVGEAPPRLEVSYEGVARDDVQGIDALSVALHELGHVLGVIANFPEADDGDFDLDGASIQGHEVAALVHAGDPSHLAARGTLMDPPISARVRTLPSAVDVLAMAAGSGWQQIDLARKEYWGPADAAAPATWSDPLQWSGGRVPGAQGDAFVRTGGMVRVGPGDAEAGRLFLDEGTTLDVSEGRVVAGEVHVAGAASLSHHGGVISGDRLVVDPTASLAIELGGAGRIPLVFLEAAELAGRLELSLAPGYVPAADDVHTLLVTERLSGAFDRVAVEPAGGSAGLDVLLEATSLSLPAGGELHSLTGRVVLRGDTNGDGRVNQADLDAVLIGWGRSAKARHIHGGDLDGNGRVDQGDLDRVLLGWGNDATFGSAANVPEPDSVLLAAAAVLTLGMWWKLRSDRVPGDRGK